MGVGEATQGWFEDPFQVHQYRWYSRGVATNLVRDGGVESYDAPPTGPPQGPLISLGQNPPSGGAGRQDPIPRRHRGWVVAGAAAAVVAAVAVLALRSQSSPGASEASAACSTSGALHYEPSGVVFATNEPLLSGVRLTRSGSGVTVVWSFHGPVNPRPGMTAEWQWVQPLPGPDRALGTGWSPLEINYGGGRWRAVVQVRRGTTTLGEVVGTPTIVGSTIAARFPASALGQVGDASHVWWTATQTVFGATPSRPTLGSAVALAACPTPSDGFGEAGSPNWSVDQYLRFPEAP